MNIEIQTPGIEDLPQIVEIFNQAIRNRFSTGFQEEFEVEDMHGWFLEHSIKNYPILVAKENDKVIGWASIKPYRKDREAFSKTMEVNYFVHNDFHRKGVGGMLLGEIQKNAANLGYKTLIAILMHVNIGSIKLLEKQKFHLWGKLPKVGYIDGVEVDHLFYGKHLTES